MNKYRSHRNKDTAHQQIQIKETKKQRNKETKKHKHKFKKKGRNKAKEKP